MDNQKFAFISVDESGKPKDKDRKLIRSHCMQGKNIKSSSSSRKSQETSENGDDDSDIPPAQSHRSYTTSRRTFKRSTLAPSHPSQPSRNVRPARPAKRSPILSDQSSHVPPTPSPSVTYPSPVPAVTRQLDDNSRSLLCSFPKKLREVIHPIAGVISVPAANPDWIPWIIQDNALINPVMFAISAIESVFNNTALDDQGQMYLNETLVLLSRRVSDDTQRLQDSNILVVEILTVFSSCLGDFQSATIHMRGLGELIRLRGGLANFRQSVLSYAKLSRLDLSYCLYTGKKPVLLTDRSWLSYLPTLHDHTSSLSPAPNPFPPSFESNYNQSLMSIFQDFQSFVTCFNIHQSAPGPPIYTLDQICSIQYRLIDMETDMNNEVAECVRLSMLALILTLSSPLRLHEDVRFPQFAERLKAYYDAVDASSGQAYALKVWTLMIGALSVFEVQDPWLRERWLYVNPSNKPWNEVRRTLKSILWIDMIHDNPGFVAFGILNSDSRDVRMTPSRDMWSNSWSSCAFDLT